MPRLDLSCSRTPTPESSVSVLIGHATGRRAVALNVTATNPTAASYVAVYPTGYAGGPGTSNLNTTAGQTVPNLVVTKVAPDGTVTLYNNSGTVDLIADLQGSYGS